MWGISQPKVLGLVCLLSKKKKKLLIKIKNVIKALRDASKNRALIPEEYPDIYYWWSCESPQ